MRLIAPKSGNYSPFWIRKISKRGRKTSRSRLDNRVNLYSSSMQNYPTHTDNKFLRIAAYLEYGQSIENFIHCLTIL